MKGIVALVALLAAVLPASRAAGQQRAATEPAAPRVPLVERMVDVDGHAMRVVTAGLDARERGHPVVVFEAGATHAIEAWGDLLPRIAARAPVVAYDRAGLGRSAWDGRSPTPRHVTDRLRRLLAEIGAEPPWVLVGYSWGGALTRFHAGYHPEDMAGLVYVDPGPIVTSTMDEALAPFEAVGAGRPGYDAYWAGVATFLEDAPVAVREEFAVYGRLLETPVAERGLGRAPDVPVSVIVAARYLPLPLDVPFALPAHFEADLRARIAALQEWALASSDGTLVVARSTTHAVLREEPDLVEWAVSRVLSAVAGRTPR